MRLALAVSLVVLPLQALASSYHACTAPLMLPTMGTGLPLPELEFTLSFSDHNPDALGFVAQGQSFNGLTVEPLLWKGSWIKDGDVLHMVGLAQTYNASEWQAQTVRHEPQVMVLNIDQGNATPLMVRCLPQEGA